MKSLDNAARLERMAKTANVELTPEVKKLLDLVINHCAVLACNQSFASCPEEYEDLNDYDRGNDDATNIIFTNILKFRSGLRGA